MTSKVVNMAPCSDRKEEGNDDGRKEEGKEGRDRNRKIDYKVTARRGSTAKGQLEGFKRASHHF